MRKRTHVVSILTALVLVLALAFPPLALAQIEQVQMGIDGMI